MDRSNRRTFVAAGGLAAAVAALGRGTLSASLKGKSATLGLGFSLYGMRTLEIQEALQTCATIGYNCVELPVMADWPGDSARLSAGERKAIGRALESAGLRLSALMENVRLVAGGDVLRANLDRLEAAGEVAHALSPEKPPVIETILGGRPAQWQSVKDQVAKRLEDWARLAERMKTVIAIKAHVGGALHTPEDTVWLVERIGSPWLKCAYDYSHFQLRGLDLARSIKTMMPHTVFIHIKDSWGSADNVRFLLPGEGDVDYAEYLRLVSAGGYRGDLLVEVSGQIHGKPGYDPVAAARRSYAVLAAAFRKAGVSRG